MYRLTSTQRNDLFQQAAQRTGLHKPILDALYRVHTEPVLPEGDTGLGVAPVNRVSLAAVGTFVDQVQYAANTLRSLTNSLIAQGWKGLDFWNSDRGHYSDKFLQAISNGYAAPATDSTAALLDHCDFVTLRRVYINLTAIDGQAAGLPQHQGFLDQALRSQVEQLPSQYLGLSYQREALLEAVRLWLGLDQTEDVITKLVFTQTPAIADPYLDSALLRFIQQVRSSYTEYPHQREALLRLIQRWYQLDSREITIITLQQGTFPESNLAALDSALIGFAQRLPHLYQGQGEQRNALVEGFRLWQQLDSRPAALIALGVNPDLFSGAALQPADIATSTAQVDRALLDFVYRVPALYAATDAQRHALLHLTQLWRNLETDEQTIQSLLDDLNHLYISRRDSSDALPAPVPVFPITRPSRWTPETIQIYTSILTQGSFTWADATCGGLYLPANQAMVDAIIYMAELLQSVRDRVNRPLTLIHWYYPLDIPSLTDRIPNHRHALGDAIVFYCDGLTGNQLYWFLDPWWTGGLGRFADYPYLCYIDGRRDRTRWQA